MNSSGRAHSTAYSVTKSGNRSQPPTSARSHGCPIDLVDLALACLEPFLHGPAYAVLSPPLPRGGEFESTAYSVTKSGNRSQPPTSARSHGCPRCVAQRHLLTRVHSRARRLRSRRPRPCLPRAIPAWSCLRRPVPSGREARTPAPRRRVRARIAAPPEVLLALEGLPRDAFPRAARRAWSTSSWTVRR
jgi:hypothetical protein